MATNRSPAPKPSARARIHYRPAFLPPPMTELDFIRHCGNHNEYSRKATSLGFSNPEFAAHANYICRAWFELGKDHLSEAKKLLTAGCLRATYSRAYYSAYNISKGVRYRVTGAVSLKGDDHGKASADLPNDFPNVANWAQSISTMYEHRLHADYDNWRSTAGDFTLTGASIVQLAEDFLSEARGYLKHKTGVVL
jgi:uncharacterized protein (UPF0332 family)